jgi:CheY-like chemotaxis protein
MFGEWHPDAAVLDIEMPGMNGFELAERLRRSATRVLLLVAVTGLEAADGSPPMRSRFDHFFLKPVDPAVLLRVLAAHAGQ